MICFPNCKINLGLSVLRKRSDKFHDIESVFYPINWCDSLELIENKGNSSEFQLVVSGLNLGAKTEDNILYKTWKEVSGRKKLPPVKLFLYKNLPFGAGLGGGSSDAAFLIELLNKKFDLQMNLTEKKEIALSVGSDVPFFLANIPVIGKGRGDVFSPIKIDLSSYYILVVHPGIHSSTAEAFSELKPNDSNAGKVEEVITKLPISQWKEYLFNDFETTIFKKYPAISDLKKQLYSSGALYASMSGSGSAVYGIFEKEPRLEFPSTFKHFLQNPSSKIL
jgi:4-diphosphocytidyl-2-C-methyl-D-erythritol kinase